MLQVSRNTSGRGVLRLIKLHQRLNLLCLPALCTELTVLAWPLRAMPPSLCACLEWTVAFVSVNRYLSGLPIALSRIAYLYD